MRASRTRFRVSLLLGFVVPCVAVVLAQHDLSWFTIDGGGDMRTAGGDLELSGTIGQPDASLLVMTGGDLELSGGFWPAARFLLGDVDHDGDVDQSDLAALLASYGWCVGEPRYNPAADFDGSGCVGQSDLAELLAHYGEGT